MTYGLICSTGFIIELQINAVFELLPGVGDLFIAAVRLRTEVEWSLKTSCTLLQWIVSYFSGKTTKNPSII